MSGDNCDTISAQCGCLGHAARIGVWRKGGLQRWAQRHGAHELGVRTLARSTSRSRPCPRWGCCNVRTWRTHAAEGVWWFATGPNGLLALVWLATGEMSHWTSLGSHVGAKASGRGTAEAANKRAGLPSWRMVVCENEF
jgi:hypothetical protein